MRKNSKRFIVLLLSMLIAILLIPATGLNVEAAKPRLTKKSGSIVIGGTSRIRVKNAPKGAKITYKSAKKNIASVSKNGRIKGIKSGTTKVTVFVKKSSTTTKLTYKVTVKKPALSNSKLSLKSGGTARLSIKNKPKKAKYTWTSSNSRVAAVDKNGAVTAKANGTATITVKVKTAKKTYRLSCKVTVSPVSGKTPETTTPPEITPPPEITINDLSDTESNNIDTETINVSGTAKAYAGNITKITYSLRFVLEDTASVNGTAEGTAAWKISNLPLRIGTSFLTITAVDSENRTISKEIILNRLNNEISLAENVILYTDEQTSVIANDIVDYWVDDMGTPDDTYDDQTKVLFRESSEIVQSIKSGSLAAGDVLMLQPCEELYLGFNGVLVSNEEPEDTQKYAPSEYEVVSFTAADYTDIFTGDVSLSYELADTENPLAFAYFPSDVEIYSMDDNGEEQAMLYSNADPEISAYATEGMGDQTKEQEIKDIGFQKNAFSYMMNDALHVTGGLSSGNGMNIGIKFKDTVLFDADGSKDTKNDQFKFGGSISYENFKVNAGIEWHPNFNPLKLDLLPQQILGKYSYTEKINAHADWTGKISLNDIKDKSGKKVGFVKAANKVLNNDFENNKKFMGMTLSGVDLSDSIILGAFGLQISPVGVTPTVGIKNTQYSSVFTPLSAILVIMPVINVEGEISAKIGFTYNYSAYNEKGVNMQKKGFVGAYGSLEDNKGQSSIDLSFGRSLEIYNVCSKSSTDKSSDPVWNLTFTGEGKSKEKLALGADIGLMVAGIMPTSAEVEIYENAEADLKGQIKVDNENGFTLDGSAEIDAKVGVMTGIHFKLAASTASFSPEIKGDKEWDKVLREIQLPDDKSESEDNKTVSLGDYHSGAITEDGSLYIWGHNTNGEVGNGSTAVFQITPVKVLSDVVSVSLGYWYSGAITEDGSLYMWGGNYEVGNGSTAGFQTTPVKVLSNVVSVNLGYNHSGAITEDGSLYMWGRNNQGEIGNGSTALQTTPVKVLSNVVSVSLGFDHSGAITEDGSLYMWGNNSGGQIGNGSAEDQTTPAKVLSDVVSVNLGYNHSGAITEDGSLYMWGSNLFGKVGNGSTEDQTTPVKVLSNIVSISLGHYHSGAVTEDGSLYMWGYNYFGEVGNGSTEDQTTPVKVLSNIVSVSLGYYHSGAITEDGSLYMWGNNRGGQIGNGSAEDQTTPVKVLSDVVSVSLGGFCSGAVTKDRSLYMWGSNSCGAVGNGSTEDQTTPVKVLDGIRLPKSAE